MQSLEAHDHEKLDLHCTCMARRRKNRTHLKGVQSSASSADDFPKSFVIKHGHVGPSLTQLTRDVRKVMEPNTATRLKVDPLFFPFFSLDEC
jgi:hypothetical protein